MWTFLTVSRWIFLLTLAAVMFLSVSQVDSYPNMNLFCCEKFTERRIWRIKECYEQTPRENCRLHAFVIEDKKSRKWCINPTSEWLTTKIQMGLKCKPILSLE